MNEAQTIDRLRITRELSQSEYRRLIEHEEKNGELTVKEIAQMFGFKKVI